MESIGFKLKDITSKLVVNLTLSMGAVPSTSGPCNCDMMDLIPVAVGEVHKLVSGMVSKSARQDFIPTILLKEAAIVPAPLGGVQVGTGDTCPKEAIISKI